LSLSSDEEATVHLTTERHRKSLLVWTLISVLVAAAMTSAGAASARNRAGAAGKPIVVAAAIGQTGFMQPFDVPPLTSFKIALAALNKQGGVLGRQVQLVVRDMKSEVSLAPRITTDAINTGASLLLVPCDPDVGAPGAIVGQQKGVLTFSLCEASSRFGPGGIGDLVFTPSQITYLEGYDMAEWAFYQRHYRHAYLIQDKTFSGYNLEVCNGFQKRFAQLAGSKGVVGTDTVSSTDTSIAATITRIKGTATKPNFIFICTSPPPAPNFLRQIRAAGINLPILSDMAMDGTYWLKAVPNLSNFYYPSAGSIYGDDPNPKIDALVAQYKRLTGKRPDTAYMLYGAAIVDLWAKAVAKAGTTDAKAVAKALETFHNVPTTLGTTTYTSTSHIALARPMDIMQIQDGKPSYLQIWHVRKPPGLKG